MNDVTRTSKERISEDRLRNTRAWASARIGEMSGAEVIVAACDEALAARASHEPATGPVAPIACIRVGEEDTCEVLHLYAPGLPPGEHDLFPVPLNPDGQLAAAMFSEALCPHGMRLAENICGPCSQGRPNRAAQPPPPALRPDEMPEPSLDVLKRVATRMRTDAPDSAYLVEWAAEQIEELHSIARAARNVCAYDWSDNDEDAVATMDRLHAVIGPWLARSASTKPDEQVKP